MISKSNVFMIFIMKLDIDNYFKNYFMINLEFQYPMIFNTRSHELNYLFMKTLYLLLI